LKSRKKCEIQEIECDVQKTMGKFFKKHKKHQKHPGVKKDVVKKSKQRFSDTKNGNLCFQETRIFNIHPEKVGGHQNVLLQFLEFFGNTCITLCRFVFQNSDEAKLTSQKTPGYFHNGIVKTGVEKSKTSQIDVKNKVFVQFFDGVCKIKSTKGHSTLTHVFVLLY